MTKISQRIWETFCEELIVEPTDDMKEALATSFRQIVDEYRVGGMLYCNDILNLADELEAL